MGIRLTKMKRIQTDRDPDPKDCNIKSSPKYSGQHISSVNILLGIHLPTPAQKYNQISTFYRKIKNNVAQGQRCPYA